MKYTITILVRTYSIYLVPKRRNLNNLAIFGYFGYFWPLLSPTDLVVAGKEGSLKNTIPKWVKNEVQFNA